MAKMFYTMEETKAALGKTEEEIKQYSRDGRLREFRDGTRLMFKADQVDQLKADLGGGTLEGAGAGGMGDESRGSGTISLADTDFGKSPGAAMIKDDAALSADLGLSGAALAGTPPSGKIAGSGSGLMGLSGATAKGSGKGVTVFDTDSGQKVDPNAQTTTGSGLHDQVNVEGVGSGSGLLDLTRESDDTSLGAELLDEISPGQRRPAGGGDTGVGMEGFASPRGPRSAIAPPVYVEQYDATAPGFGALALFGAILLIGGGFVVINAMVGVRPEVVAKLSGKESDGHGPVWLATAVLGGLIFWLVGWLIGRYGDPKRKHV